MARTKPKTPAKPWPRLCGQDRAFAQRIVFEFRNDLGKRISSADERKFSESAFYYVNDGTQDLLRTCQHLRDLAIGAKPCGPIPNCASCSEDLPF